MSGEAAETRPAEAALLREMDGLRQDVRDHREQMDRKLDGFRSEARTRLDAVVEQTTATNGRLRRVELFVAGVKALGVLFGALTPFAIYFLSTQ